MVSFDSTQLAGWLSMYFWPMLRILALVSTAPITSEKQVPKKVKIGLAAMITFLIAPALPVVDTPIFLHTRAVADHATNYDRHCARPDHAAGVRRHPHGR